MRELGLFGATIPAEYGGLGLPAGIYAKIVTRISEVWMSLTGIFNSHLIMSKAVERFGTQAQRDRFLPRFASGEIRGGLALTEPNCGTDLQAIRTTAVRQGGNFTINGTKTWISNGIEGSCFALLVKTDPEVRPRHRGMSLFLAEKANGQVSEDNLIGGEEGQGFYQTVGGLELGRINVATRGVGIANAALKEATSYSQVRETMGKPICEHQAIQTRSMSSQLQPVRKHPTRSNLVSPAGLGNDEGIAALSVSVIERC